MKKGRQSRKGSKLLNLKKHRLILQNLLKKSRKFIRKFKDKPVLIRKEEEYYETDWYLSNKLQRILYEVKFSKISIIILKQNKINGT